MATVGDRIGELRRLKNWSLDELATASNIAMALLERFEGNQSSPTLWSMARLATSFEMDLNELLNGVDEVIIKDRDGGMVRIAVENSIIVSEAVGHPTDAVEN